MATTLEILRGISQVIANSYDGALDEKGEPIKIGLRREEGDPIIDSRVMDGFKVTLRDNICRIHYHAEIDLKEAHDSNFEGNIAQTIADVKNYLQKEYKKVTGSSLSLKEFDEPVILVQTMSRIRNWIQCYQDFKIRGVKADPTRASSEEDPVRAATLKFLEIGKPQYAGTEKPLTAIAKG